MPSATRAGDRGEVRLTEREEAQLH